MSTSDPNIEVLESFAEILEDLLPNLILVGGCAVGLLVTDKAQTPIRPTVDVDLITEALTLPDYYEVCEELRKRGFQHGDITCRFKHNKLIVDLMSANLEVLGFTNKWYDSAGEMSVKTTLPSGRAVRHVTAPLMIATKIDSFQGRGNGDYNHHDLEDIITLVDGREELVVEIKENPKLRGYIESEIEDLLADQAFVDALPGHLRPGDQGRLPIVIERLRKIAGL